MPTTTPLTDAINALTTYANETTGASDTTLSQAVATLVAGYGGGGGTTVLTHNWDFKQSLTDTVGGVAATITNCTQSSSGLYFGQSNSKLSFPNKMLKANSRIEIDIASYNRQGTNHGRLLMVSGDQGFAYRSTGYWGLYRNYGGTNNGWYMTTISDPTYFDGHTLKLIINEYGAINFYRDDDFIIEGLAMLIDGSFTIGSSSNAAYYLTITGMRIYENTVSEADLNELADGSIAGSVEITASNIRENFFKGLSHITSISCPNVTRLSGGFASSCSALVSVSCPNATTINSTQQFISCTSLTSVNLPLLTVPGGNMFQGCTSLEFIDLPSITRMNVSRVFYGCNKLKTIVLRNPSVVSLNSDVFINTPFAGYNNLTGTAYVPSSLISSYQTASNWSTLYNNGTCNFVAIEGSQYE